MNDTLEWRVRLDRLIEGSLHMLSDEHTPNTLGLLLQLRNAYLDSDVGDNGEAQVSVGVSFLDLLGLLV